MYSVTYQLCDADVCSDSVTEEFNSLVELNAFIEWVAMNFVLLHIEQLEVYET